MDPEADGTDLPDGHLRQRIGASMSLEAPNGFSLPLTQAQLAGMCGTTTVHMSRALRRLREATGAKFRHGSLECSDPAALRHYCDYDPSYLYGPGELQFSGGDYAD